MPFLSLHAVPSPGSVVHVVFVPLTAGPYYQLVTDIKRATDQGKHGEPEALERQVLEVRERVLWLISGWERRRRRRRRCLLPSGNWRGKNNALSDYDGTDQSVTRLCSCSDANHMAAITNEGRLFTWRCGEDRHLGYGANRSMGGAGAGGWRLAVETDPGRCGGCMAHSGSQLGWLLIRVWARRGRAT